MKNMSRTSHKLTSDDEEQAMPSGLQDDLWGPLLKHAAHEIEQITEKMEDLFSAEEPLAPVTVHLYQPVPIEAGEKVAHRLVDIGPRSEDLEPGMIAQVGGQTESFFQTPEFYKRFLPSVRQITSETVEEYRKVNRPRKRRAVQVALEKRRHPSVSGWPEDPAPPPETWIHQLPLSPLPDRFSSRRSHPVIGVVYTLSSYKDVSSLDVGELTHDERRCIEAIYQLPVYAMRSGDVALRERLNLLTCGTRRSLLEGYAGREPGDRCLTAASLLLAHHWFFRDPVARILIYKLLAHRLETARPCIELDQLWTSPYIYGSSISKKSALKDPRSSVELFDILCSDLQQLISLICATSQTDAKQEAGLREAVATMLMIMTGELYRGDWVKRDYRSQALKRGIVSPYEPRGRDHKGLVLLNTLPLVARGKELPLCLPMVSEATASETRGTKDVIQHLRTYTEDLHPFWKIQEDRRKGSTKSVAWSIVSHIDLTSPRIRAEYQGWPEDPAVAKEEMKRNRRPPGNQWLQWLRELVYYRSAQEYLLLTGRYEQPDTRNL